MKARLRGTNQWLLLSEVAPGDVEVLLTPEQVSKLEALTDVDDEEAHGGDIDDAWDSLEATFGVNVAEFLVQRSPFVVVVDWDTVD